MADHDLTETRRLVREFLAGQRYLRERGLLRWPFEVLIPHKRHRANLFIRGHMYRVVDGQIVREALYG